MRFLPLLVFFLLTGCPLSALSDVAESETSRSDVALSAFNTSAFTVPNLVTGGSAAPALPAGAVHVYEARASGTCPTTGLGNTLTTYPDDGSGNDSLMGVVAPSCEQDSGEWYVDYDGSNDYHLAVDAAFDDLTQPFTWCGVFRFDVATGFELLWDNESGTGSNRAQVGRNGSDQFYMWAGAFLIGPTITDSNWHYGCALFDGASSKLTVDGTEYTGDAGSNGLDSITAGARGGTRVFKHNGGQKCNVLWGDDQYTGGVACGESAGCLCGATISSMETGPEEASPIEKLREVFKAIREKMLFLPGMSRIGVPLW